MKFRSLDGTGDWQFGQGLESYATDNNAIAFDIQTSILSFFKDCWFSPSSGIDWLRLMGSKSTQQEISLNIRGTILKCDGVEKINFIRLSFQNRRLSVTYNVNTIFSQNNEQIVEVI